MQDSIKEVAARGRRRGGRGEKGDSRQRGIGRSGCLARVDCERHRVGERRRLVRVLHKRSAVGKMSVQHVTAAQNSGAGLLTSSKPSATAAHASSHRPSAAWLTPTPAPPPSRPP